MAVTGNKQNTERVIYGSDGGISFVSLRYAFEGLPTDTPLDEGQLLDACILAEEGDALPDPNEPSTWPSSATGLTLRRVDVRRYSPRAGEARITIQWGEFVIRGGPAPDVESVRQRTVTEDYEIPLLIDSQNQVVQGSDGASSENIVSLRREPVTRVGVRDTYSQIGGASASEVRTFVLNNFGSYYTQFGIFLGASIQPINQTQFEIRTEFLNRSPLPPYEANQLQPFAHKPVEALPLNGEYITPEPGDDMTETRGPEEIYNSTPPQILWFNG